MSLTIRMMICSSAAAILLGGCATDQLLTTQGIAPTAEPAVAKVDPGCTALATQIQALRSEGTIERVEKAAAGRTKTVSVKRESLAKVAEFNRLNADYRARCSQDGLVVKTSAPATTAAAAPAAATSVSAPVAAAAAPAKPVAKPAN